MGYRYSRIAMELSDQPPQSAAQGHGGSELNRGVQPPSHADLRTRLNRPRNSLTARLAALSNPHYAAVAIAVMLPAAKTAPAALTVC